MTKFRRLPIVVEAYQWTEELEYSHAPVPGVARRGSGNFVTPSHGQDYRLRIGDWVVAEANDWQFYTVPNDLFLATHVPL